MNGIFRAALAFVVLVFIGLPTYVAVNVLHDALNDWTYFWIAVVAVGLVKAAFDWPSRYEWPFR